MKDKKEVVTNILDEIEKAIHKNIDEGRVDEYTPLDLIYMAIVEIIQAATHIQDDLDDFDKDDGKRGGKLN